MGRLRTVEQKWIAGYRSFVLTRGWRVMGLACLISLAAGCGGGGPAKPKTVPIKGTVTYKGQAVTGGEITFAPVGGGGKRAGSGPIQSDGSFVISSYDAGDGVEAGDYKVILSPPPPSPETKDAPATSAIPQKYLAADSTPLKETIGAGDSGKSLEIKLED